MNAEDFMAFLLAWILFMQFLIFYQTLKTRDEFTHIRGQYRIIADRIKRLSEPP